MKKFLIAAIFSTMLALPAYSWDAYKLNSYYNAPYNYNSSFFSSYHFSCYNSTPWKRSDINQTYRVNNYGEVWTYSKATGVKHNTHTGKIDIFPID